MATARKLLIDESVSGIYHCFSRCVRQAYLIAPQKKVKKSKKKVPSVGRKKSKRTSEVQSAAESLEATIEVDDHRREWIMWRLAELAKVFGIDCISVAVMSNHLHLLLRNLPEVVRDWSDAEVAFRWFTLHPAQDIKRVAKRSRDAKLTKEEIDSLIGCKKSIATWRERLSSISWYMKELKEPIARRSNEEDDVTGAFWEERFKSYRVRDNLGLLVCASYIDLNPVTAGICESPLSSRFTSIELQVNRMEKEGNEQIRALWRRYAEMPDAHEYEEPDEDLEAFIDQFDDAEFLPSLPARRSAHGIADSWFPPGHFAKPKPSSRSKKRHGKKSGASIARNDLSDLQPEKLAPIEELPIMSTRSYLRRLNSLAKLRREACQEADSNASAESRSGLCRIREIRELMLEKLRADMEELAEKSMNELESRMTKRHGSGSVSQSVREREAFRINAVRKRTDEMIERVATRFEEICIDPALRPSAQLV